jgi:hypothetical protein
MDKVVDDDDDDDDDVENPPLRFAFSNTDRKRFRSPVRSALGRNPAWVMIDGADDDDVDEVEVDDDDDVVVVELEEADVDRVKSLLTNNLVFVDDTDDDVDFGNVPTTNALDNITMDDNSYRW